MIIKQFLAGLIENNMYLVIDEKTGDAVVIDAPADIPELHRVINELKVNVKYILITHGHFDHIVGLNSLKKSLNAPAVICKEDLVISDNVNEFTRLFGVPDIIPPTYEKFVVDGEALEVGDMKIKVIQTPGHTEGGVCYLIEDNLFSGDTLFKQSVGRTDLFGGSFEKIRHSVKEILFNLDENIKVFPGHGPMTTIAYEKKYNEIIWYTFFLFKEEERLCTAKASVINSKKGISPNKKRR